MRKRMSSGFTLIELMVVVVLVMILALAIVPTFKEIIVKAKYTEGSAAISALRTKIKVYYIDNSRLPGVPAITVENSTNMVGGASWWGTNGTAMTAISAVTSSLPLTASSAADLINIVQTMCSKTNEMYGITAVSPANGTLVYGDPVGELSKWQADLDISMGDYAGAYFKNKDYQYAAFNAGIRSASYGYVILAAGSGEKKSPPVGTGYGVMEIQNTDWSENRLLTLTFERYKERPGAGNAPLFLCPGTAANGIVSNKVVFPMWGTVASQTAASGFSTSDNKPNITNFTAIGWSAQ